MTSQGQYYQNFYLKFTSFYLSVTPLGERRRRGAKIIRLHSLTATLYNSVLQDDEPAKMCRLHYFIHFKDT